MAVSNSKQHNSNDLHTSRNFSTGFLLFLAGGGIGAALALLFAPKSGSELRTDITDLTKKGYDETLELAQHFKEQSADVYHSLKEKTGKVYDLAAGTWSRAHDAVEDSPRLLGEIINGEAAKLHDEPSSKKAAGRRSSNIL